jgi:hypothetical protein
MCRQAQNVGRKGKFTHITRLYQKSKVFLTARCAKVTQRVQYVDNQSCHFASLAISLRTLRLKILLIQPQKQSGNRHCEPLAVKQSKKFIEKSYKKFPISKKSCIFATGNCELIIFNF